MLGAHGWCDMLEPAEALASAGSNGTKTDAQKSLLRALEFFVRKSEPTRASNAIDLSVRQEFVSFCFRRGVVF